MYLICQNPGRLLSSIRIMASAFSSNNGFDASRHLSIVAKNRGISPLKGLHKYLGIPGLISLAGGLPNPDYFPFDVLSAEVLPHDKYPTAIPSSTQRGTLDWLWSFLPSKAPTSTITIPKYANADALQLSTTLQYSLAQGIPQLNTLCKEITTKVHQPAFKDWGIFLDTGNTDGWIKCIQTFCNPGEAILFDEWTYPTALAASKPLGMSAVPIAIDEQGMCSKALRQTLETWDETARGVPTPHVIYIVPIGQNPTGATMTFERKSEIYNICVEYDILIVEDDPYFFLQFGDYLLPGERLIHRNSTRSDEEFLSGLSHSFLRLDNQGRVVRLDSFSKTIAPGSRLGWITCHPLYAERLERVAEVSTNAPCGFSQTLITKLLHHWTFEGFIRWNHGLAVQYKRRRDLLVDLFMKNFDLKLESSGIDPQKASGIKYLAYPKRTRSNSNIEKRERAHIFSLSPPTSGMFVWLKFNLEGRHQTSDDGDETPETLFWITVAKEGLLIGPGYVFAADGLTQAASTEGHFRISFSNQSDDTMVEAIERLARAVNKFYGL